MFLIDCVDKARFIESKTELDSLLTDEQLANCPVLILGNKIDIPGAASEDELRSAFGLYGQTTGKGKVLTHLFNKRFQLQEDNNRLQSLTVTKIRLLIKVLLEQMVPL